MRRADQPLLLRLSILVAALSLAMVVTVTVATPLHSEPGEAIAVKEASFAEPMAVERPVATATGFENSERPNIRPEPAVSPETRALKLKISQQQKAERQEAERQEAERREAAQQEAAREEAERREAQRQEAARREAQQQAEREKAKAEAEKAARAAATRNAAGKVQPLPAGVSERTRARPAFAKNKPGALRLAPQGGKMALTIDRIGLRNSPIETSDEQRVLDRGLMHLPQTSRPWERGRARNVYLVGHRMGWPGTRSWKIFYRLDELQSGDQLVLTAGDKTYRYKVTEKLVVTPWDVWITDSVKGRDLLTLQTCTGPNFSQRLIIRADRV